MTPLGWFLTPSLPHVTFWWHCSPFPCEVTIFILQKHSFSIMDKKCHGTFWLTPSLPYMSFGDTVVTSSSPMCHDILEWPKIAKIHNWKNKDKEITLLHFFAASSSFSNVFSNDIFAEQIVPLQVPQGVNFTNILQTAFLLESVLQKLLSSYILAL